MFSSTPGLLPLDANSIFTPEWRQSKTSPENSECPLEATLLIKNPLAIHSSLIKTKGKYFTLLYFTLSSFQSSFFILRALKA